MKSDKQIFHHLKLEFASAIPALNESKIEKNNSAAGQEICIIHK